MKIGLESATPEIHGLLERGHYSDGFFLELKKNPVYFVLLCHKVELLRSQKIFGSLQTTAAEHTLTRHQTNLNFCMSSS